MSGPEIPAPADDAAKKRLEVRKLELEIRNLEQQLTPAARRWQRLGTLSGLAGMITATIGIVAFVWGVWQGLQQLENGRQSLADTQLRATIARLGSSNDSERLIGVLELKGFLERRYSGVHARVLQILAIQQASEASPLVRDAITDTFASIDTAVVAPDAVDAAMRLILERNRALVGVNRLRRLTLLRGPGLDVVRASPETATAEALGRSAAALARKGSTIHDLSGLYCVGCDFSGLKAANIRFDHAILSKANFDHAILPSGSFLDALLEGTHFVGADLRGANFRGRPASGGGFFGALTSLFDDYPDEVYAALRWDAISGPRFNCARLDAADFSQRILFTVFPDDPPIRTPWASDTGGPGWLASFVHARLDGTRFSYMGIIGTVLPDQKPDADDDHTELPFSQPAHASRSTGVPLQVSREAVKPPQLPDGLLRLEMTLNSDSRLTKAAGHYVDSLRYIQDAFKDAEWRSAVLPEGVRELLLEPDRIANLKHNRFTRYPADLFDASCANTAAMRPTVGFRSKRLRHAGL